MKSTRGDPKKGGENAGAKSLKIGVPARFENLSPDPVNSLVTARSRSGRSPRASGPLVFNVPILVDRDDNIISGHGPPVGLC